MKKKAIIFGTGDIAQIANYYFTIDSDVEVEAFTADKAYIQQNTFEGKPVVAFEELETIYPPAEYGLFVALSYAGLNKLRAQKCAEGKAKGYQLLSYISSHATYLSQFPPGENCFIFEDNTIQPFVKIGNNVTLWSGNHIGHHSEIHDDNFISSHVVISGHSVIMSNCFVGVNATLAHNVTLAKETLVGAGAVVAKSTAEGSVIVPAKSVVLDKKSSEFKL